MKPNYCDRETAVLEALDSGRWPHGCDHELCEHVARCSICADVALVAQSLRRENQQARSETAPRAAGLVWWKAQLRSKREAQLRAAEPIAMVERAAALTVPVALAALAVWRWDSVTSWLAWFRDLSRATIFRPDALWPLAGSPTFLLVLTLSACLLLASLALYLFATESPQRRRR